MLVPTADLLGKELVNSPIGPPSISTEAVHVVGVGARWPGFMFLTV